MKQRLAAWLCTLCLLWMWTVPVLAGADDRFSVDTVSDGLSLCGYEGDGNMTVPAVIDGQPVVEVAESAFYGSELIRVQLPSSMRRILPGAFEGSLRLRSVTAAEGLTQLGDGAFRGCSALQSVQLPASITVIGDAVFEGCSDRLVVQCVKDSAVDRYCQAQGIAVTYPHNHRPNSVRTEPTCTQAGEVVTVCLDCNTVLDRQPIAAPGHQGVPEVVLPTCTQEGSDRIICARCDATLSGSTSPALGHEEVYIEIAADCETAGKQERSCKRCGMVLSLIEQPMLGHEMSDWEPVRPADYEQEGEEKRICGRCGLEETRSIPILSKISIAKVQVKPIPSVTYRAAAWTPKVTLSYEGLPLAEEVDYTLSYQNNLHAGKAQVLIEGIGAYSGQTKVSFTIRPKPLTERMAQTIPRQRYSGKAVEPAVQVQDNAKRLVEGRDFTVVYGKHTNVGKASVLISGRGNYSGAVRTAFTIEPLSLKTAQISSIQEVTYNGSEVRPKPMVRSGGVTLREGTDYRASYRNTVEAGLAGVTLEGRGNYKDQVQLNFLIKKRSITACKVYGLKDQQYDGQAQTPPILVKDGKKTLRVGLDYDVRYRDNRLPGTAKVTISGRGNYQGSIQRSFEILLPRVGTVRFSAGQTTVKLQWDRLEGISGYRVYQGNTVRQTAKANAVSCVVSGLKSGTHYSFRVVPYRTIGGKSYEEAGTLIQVCTAPGVPSMQVTLETRQVTLRWGAVKGAVGYEIWRSSKATSGYTRVAQSGKTNYRTNRAKGTQYYKVRAYSTLNGQRIYGPFSKIGTVKTR